MINNEYLLNYTNIILFFALILMLFSYLPIFIKRKSIDFKLDKTRDYVKYNLRYLISVFAKIRAGKTSTVNGLVHIKERELYETCLNQMLDIIDFLPHVDFYKLNLALDKICVSDDSFYCKWNDMTIEAFELCHIKDGIVNDFINCKSVYEIIHRYIECYYVVMYRGIYVYSKNWRYSFASGMHSRFLSDNTMNIKDVCITHEFYLRNWSIVIEDELSLNRGNILSNSKVAKDTGKKELKALFGQIFEETVVYFGIKQRNDDEISSDRKLYTNYLSLESRKIISNYSFFIKYFEFRKKILELRYRFCYFIVSNIARNIKSEYGKFDSYKFTTKCRYRFKAKKFDNAIRFFKSLATVRVDLIEYERIEDVGKKELGEKHVLYLPLRETIGNYDTHDYRFVMDILNDMSHVLFSAENSYFKSMDNKLMMASFLFEHSKDGEKT